MAGSSAFAAQQYAEPTTASSDEAFDHQLVDLLWFYGCVATAPSALICNGAHIAHNTLLSVDHRLITCAHPMKCSDRAIQQHQPASRASQSIDVAAIQSFHQSLRKTGQSCSREYVNIVAPSRSFHQNQVSQSKADASTEVHNTIRGSGATTSSKVNNATGISIQQSAPTASPASERWLRQVFNTFDENKDGMLSMDELRRSLEKLGIETSKESIDTLLSHSPSKDQKGLVSQDEFLLLYQGASCTQCNIHDNVEHIGCNYLMKQDGADEELLWDAFNVFDKDGDGFISPVELQSVLCSLGFGAAQQLEECIEMIKRYDQDGDGHVDFEEFKAMLNLAIRHT